jgi:hypothetical protein
MEGLNIEDMTFDDIISLLKSKTLDENKYSIIYKSFPKIIRRNFRHIPDTSESEEEREADEDEEYKEYERLVDFFKNLIILKKLDLLKEGLKTAYDIDENINMILYDLGLTFFKNKMLKEYYEIVTKFNNNKYFVDEALTEQIGDMFLDIEPNKIYYLITETAIFAIKNRHYQLMKFIVDSWNSRDNESTINFKTEGMSDEDMKNTLKTIDLLNDIYNERSK